MSLSALRNVVSAAASDTAEVNAVIRELTRQGHRGAYDCDEHRGADRKIVRVYLWRDTPLGHLALMTGPSIKGQIFEVDEVPAGAEVTQADVNLYIPAKGRRPAFAAFKAARRNGSAARTAQQMVSATSYGTGYSPSGEMLPGQQYARTNAGRGPDRQPRLFKVTVSPDFDEQLRTRYADHAGEVAEPPPLSSTAMVAAGRGAAAGGPPRFERAPVFAWLYDAAGRRYRVAYRVLATAVNGSGPVLASNLPGSFTDTPDYPPAFQARSLGRLGERQKIDRIAREMDPARMLMPHADPTFGAPVVWEGNGEAGTRPGRFYVLGGNSRTIAFLMAPADKIREYDAAAAELWGDIWPAEPPPAGMRWLVVRQAYAPDCPTLNDALALNAACQMPFAQAQGLAGATQQSMAGRETPLGEAVSLVRGLGITGDLAAMIPAFKWSGAVARDTIPAFLDSADNRAFLDAISGRIGRERYQGFVADPDNAAKLVNSVLIGFLPRAIIERGFGSEREERALLGALPTMATIRMWTKQREIPEGFDLLPHLEDARQFADAISSMPMAKARAYVEQMYAQQSLALRTSGGDEVRALGDRIGPLGVLLGLAFKRAEGQRDPTIGIDQVLVPYAAAAWEAGQKFDIGKQAGLFGGGSASPKMPADYPAQVLGAIVARAIGGPDAEPIVPRTKAGERGDTARDIVSVGSGAGAGGGLFGGGAAAGPAGPTTEPEPESPPMLGLFGRSAAAPAARGPSPLPQAIVNDLLNRSDLATKGGYQELARRNDEPMRRAAREEIDVLATTLDKARAAVEMGGPTGSDQRLMANAEAALRKMRDRLAAADARQALVDDISASYARIIRDYRAALGETRSEEEARGLEARYSKVLFDNFNRLRGDHMRLNERLQGQGVDPAPSLDNAHQVAQGEVVNLTDDEIRRRFSAPPPPPPAAAPVPAGGSLADELRRQAAARKAAMGGGSTGPAAGPAPAVAAPALVEPALAPPPPDEDPLPGYIAEMSERDRAEVLALYREGRALDRDAAAVSAKLAQHVYNGLDDARRVWKVVRDGYGSRLGTKTVDEAADRVRQARQSLIDDAEFFQNAPFNGPRPRPFYESNRDKAAYLDAMDAAEEQAQKAMPGAHRELTEDELRHLGSVLARYVKQGLDAYVAFWPDGAPQGGARAMVALRQRDSMNGRIYADLTVTPVIPAAEAGMPRFIDLRVDKFITETLRHRLDEGVTRLLAAGGFGLDRRKDRAERVVARVTVVEGGDSRSSMPTLDDLLSTTRLTVYPGGDGRFVSQVMAKGGVAGSSAQTGLDNFDRLIGALAPGASLARGGARNDYVVVNDGDTFRVMTAEDARAFLARQEAEWQAQSAAKWNTQADRDRRWEQIGQAKVPGIRFQEALSAGRLWEAVEAGTVSRAEWDRYLADLRAEGKIRDPDPDPDPPASRAAAPSAPSAADKVAAMLREKMGLTRINGARGYGGGYGYAPAYRRNGAKLGQEEQSVIREILANSYGRGKADQDGVLALLLDAVGQLPDDIDTAQLASNILDLLNGILQVFDVEKGAATSAPAAAAPMGLPPEPPPPTPRTLPSAAPAYAEPPAAWAEAPRAEDWRLLASGPTAQGLLPSIAQFFGGEQKQLIPVGPDVWAVSGAQGILSAFRVVKRKGRAHFEAIPPKAAPRAPVEPPPLAAAPVRAAVEPPPLAAPARSTAAPLDSEVWAEVERAITDVVRGLR